MKKMNKKGFTLVELLAVIVILAILMAIAATNIGPVIDNSRRSSMRTTAQMIITGVQTQLQTNLVLEPGTYEFSKAILERGGISAPFGGDYVYREIAATDSKIGAGVIQESTTAKDVVANCGENKTSFVSIDRDAGGNYIYSICLSTTKGGWLAGTREQVDDTSSNKKEQIFYGKADTTGYHKGNNNGG